MWVLAVIPPQEAWDEVEDVFVEASLHFEQYSDLQVSRFGFGF